MGQTQSNYPEITYCVVKKHQYWLYCDQYVYDVQSYINIHPGGQWCLLRTNYRSISKDISYHGSKAKKIMQSHIIGKICKCVDHNCQICHK